MNRFTLLLVVFLIGIIQVVTSSFLKIGGVSPNFLLLTIIYLAFAKSQINAILSSFVGGLILDLFSGQIFGIFTLSFFLISYFINIGKFYLFTEINLWIFLILAVLGTMVFNLLIFSLNQLVILSGVFPDVYTSFKSKEILSLVARETIYNLIVAFVVFLIIKKLRKGRILKWI